MKLLRPIALVILVAASFSSSAQPPSNVISLDEYSGFAYGGEGSNGGSSGRNLLPGRIHAASLWAQIAL